MDPALYNICFPDIFSQIASYLEVVNIANIAKLNSRFAQIVGETGLLYRHVSLVSKKTKSRRKATSDDLNIRRLLPCLEQSPYNASSITSLSVRHRFSGYLPSEEIAYVERIASITKLCPNLFSLSLHLSNFATSYYIAGTNSEYMKTSEGTTRAIFCQSFCDGEVSFHTPQVIDNLLAGMGNLRSLNWCLECRPSGLLSEDWKTSRLREELEMIDRACPKLEHLGLLNFFDSRVLDEIIHDVVLDETENFILDGGNALCGILRNLQEITFYIAGERDQEKILSAAALGLTLGRWRRISSKIVPWCQDKASQKLIIDDITHVMKVQKLMNELVNISLEEFIFLWGQYLRANFVFEVDLTLNDTLHLDLVNLLCSQAKSVNIALKAKDLSPDQLHKLVLPTQTKSLSINTNCFPLSSIAHLTSQLDLQSSISRLREYIPRRDR